MAEGHLNTKDNKQLAVVIVTLLILIIGAIIYFPNYAKLRQLRNENKRLIQENKQLEEEITDYGEKIGALGKDPYIYEKIAREDLGVARENEIVVDIEE